jgi:tetraacyldisaccharide 4'-kinase
VRTLQAIIADNVIALWEKTTTSSVLYLSEKVIFFFLRICEIIYRLGFFVTQKAKPIFFRPYHAPCKVVALGNLSVGGTGKSVLTQFLIKNLTGLQCAVVMRGYKSQANLENKSLLVSDGKNIFYGPDNCGDEAFMIASNTSVPLAIGANRVQAFDCLMQSAHHNEQALDIVILDDAYQNQQLVKDFQILLLDARKPFENGHCLPAGRLREKDYTRADVIILTHADRVSSQKIWDIKKNLLKKIISTHIFCGIHKVSRILIDNKEPIDLNDLANKPLLACAGIGSFLGFLQSLDSLKLSYTQIVEFQDHHKYTSKDITNLIHKTVENSCQGIITTQKDWCKIAPLLAQTSQSSLVTWYVVPVEFEFLSTQEYHSFMKVVTKKLS